jgi:hypothetical protein
MKICIAALPEVDLIWPLISHKLEEAVDRCGDDLSVGEMWQMCRSGNAYLVAPSLAK